MLVSQVKLLVRKIRAQWGNTFYQKKIGNPHKDTLSTGTNAFIFTVVALAALELLSARCNFFFKAVVTDFADLDIDIAVV